MRRTPTLVGLALTVLAAAFSGSATARAADPFAAGCPAKALEEGTAAGLNSNPAARKAIVPAGAVSVLVCRYYGFGAFGKQTKQTQARVGRLRGEGLASGRDLLESLRLEFQELLAAPRGPISCPFDEGAELYAVFSYRDAAPVILDVNLSGCRFVSGGVPRAREMTIPLQKRLELLAEGKRPPPETGQAVGKKGAVGYPPPHLTLAHARQTSSTDLESFCEESELCRSFSIGACTRRSAKSIGCRYLATLLSGEECRGTVRVTALRGSGTTSSPGTQDGDEGECFYLFAPPGFKEEEEEFEREEEGRKSHHRGHAPRRTTHST